MQASIADTRSSDVLRLGRPNAKYIANTDVDCGVSIGALKINENAFCCHFFISRRWRLCCSYIFDPFAPPKPATLKSSCIAFCVLICLSRVEWVSGMATTATQKKKLQEREEMGRRWKKYQQKWQRSGKSNCMNRKCEKLKRWERFASHFFHSYFLLGIFRLIAVRSDVKMRSKKVIPSFRHNDTPSDEKTKASGIAVVHWRCHLIISQTL